MHFVGDRILWRLTPQDELEEGKILALASDHIKISTGWFLGRTFWITKSQYVSTISTSTVLGAIRRP